MYEPYEERKRFKLNLDKMKEKVKEITGKLREKTGGISRKISEKARSIGINNWVVVGVALLVLVLAGGYTGYTAYTSKIEESQSQILILEKQIDALQQDLENAQNSIASCSLELENAKIHLGTTGEELLKIKGDLQIAESKLETYMLDKETLTQNLQEKGEELANLEVQYNTLKEDFKNLDDDFNIMECNYAKKICGIVGWNYYYLSDMAVVCCGDVSIESCGNPKPTTADVIKQITC